MYKRLESQTGFEDAIRNDPTSLLKVTKKHTLDFKESKVWALVVPSVCRACFNYKKGEKESLLDCNRRLKTSREILYSNLSGPTLAHEATEEIH